MNDNENNNADNEAEVIDITEDAQAEATPEEKPEIHFGGSVEADLKNKLVRLQADFDNFRKRSNAGKQEAREEARREIILHLLPVYDNFERAMVHAREQEDYGALRTGIEGIMQQMNDFFQRHNVRNISAEPGTAFNPSMHDAVGTVQGNVENHETVAQEVLKGYVINGFVVRPAQVLVYAAT